MEESISSINIKCYEAFNKLARATHQAPAQFGDQITSSLVTELFDRYRLWAGNVGAAHGSHNERLSLDYRLREASWLKLQVIDLVTRLHDNLEGITQILCEKKAPFENLANRSIDSSTPLSKSENQYESSDDESWESSSSEDAELDTCRDTLLSTLSIEEPSLSRSDTQLNITVSPEKEVPYLCHSVKLLIDYLYEIPIRKPAPMNRLMKHDNTSLFNKCVTPFDVLYVRDLLQHVSMDAANRMGRMNTQRRRILEYRKRHYQNLQTDAAPETVLKLPLESKINPTEVPRLQVQSAKSGSEFGKVSQTKATTFREPQKLSNLLKPPPSIAASEVSRVSTHTAKDIPLQIPAQPVELARGRGYVCPYCFILVQTMSEKSWVKHIFKDLQPYVCTFDNCNLGEHFFSSEDEWYAHEARYHRCSWSCNTDGHENYLVETDFLDHLHAEHGMELTIQQLFTMGEAFRRTSKVFAGACHLCGSKTTNLKKHIARHLERIACFILPRLETELDSVLGNEGSNEAVDLSVVLSQNEFAMPSDEADQHDTKSKEHFDENVTDSEPFQLPTEKRNGLLEESSKTIEDPVIPDATEGWEECIPKFNMARNDEGLLPTLEGPISSFWVAAQNVQEMKEYRKSLMTALESVGVESGQDTIREALPWTCAWIFETPDFREWFNRNSSSNNSILLWIRGGPGCGKSTLIKFISERTQKSVRTIVSSYYFRSNSSQLAKSSLGLWRSLLFQILSQAEDLQMVLDTLTLGTILETCTFDVVCSLFSRILPMLKQRHLICFIDALNECAEDEYQDIVDYFKSLDQLARSAAIKLSICVSSRYPPNEFADLGTQIHLGIQTGHKQDISQFIDAALGPHLSAVSEEVTYMILRKAYGMFLWAVVAVSFINHSKLQSASTIINLIDSLPHDLDDLYCSIISAIHNSQPRLVLSLRWMVYARRLLELDELYFGILCENEKAETSEMGIAAILTGQERELFISSCSSGLIIFHQSTFMQFIHGSIWDFLLHSDLLDDSQILQDVRAIGPSHEQLKACCVQQLVSNDLIQDWRQAPKTIPQGYPLLEYAVSNVLYHAEQAEAAGISQRDFLRRFMWHFWKLLYKLFHPNEEFNAIDTTKDEISAILKALDLPHLQDVWISQEG